MANAQTTFAKANAIPYRPDVDEANVPRTTKAGAGAFTHYHNLTFYATKDMEAGNEIFVFYDVPIGTNANTKRELNWWKDRVNTTEYNQIVDVQDNHKSNRHNPRNGKHQRDIQWLHQNGLCLDNIQIKQSKIKGAGRGAFASRFLPKGSIIAPMPLVVIPHRHALKIDIAKKKKKINEEQLIRNYCLGHENSTLLFYPLAPGVNLINHAPTPTTTTADKRDKNESETTKKKKIVVSPTANVKIQWSTAFHEKEKDLPTTFSLEEIKSNPHLLSSKLMMEIIAIRDIQPKEEILLDYGPTWTQAWSQHEQSWEAPPNAKAYSPAYVMEDVAGLLRTEKEQQEHPYPSNLDISCFYQYSIYHAKKNDGIIPSTRAKNEATTVKWQMDRKTFEFKNLRPCNVMSREKMPNGHWIYTVQMKNRAGLPKEEFIPKGELHVVSNVPRGAIRFTDKVHSTDQHLPNAFRHEIGIPDDIFPSQWKDLNMVLNDDEL